MQSNDNQTVLQLHTTDNLVHQVVYMKTREVAFSDFEEKRRETFLHYLQMLNIHHDFIVINAAGTECTVFDNGWDEKDQQAMLEILTDVIRVYASNVREEPVSVRISSDVVSALESNLRTNEQFAADVVDVLADNQEENDTILAGIQFKMMKDKVLNNEVRTVLKIEGA